MRNAGASCNMLYNTYIRRYAPPHMHGYILAMFCCQANNLDRSFTKFHSCVVLRDDIDFSNDLGTWMLLYVYFQLSHCVRSPDTELCTCQGFTHTCECMATKLHHQFVVFVENLRSANPAALWWHCFKPLCPRSFLKLPLFQHLHSEREHLCMYI